MKLKLKFYYNLNQTKARKCLWKGQLSSIYQKIFSFKAKYIFLYISIASRSLIIMSTAWISAVFHSVQAHANLRVASPGQIKANQLDCPTLFLIIHR